jgi:prepilin-type N-terminal cleavage/methylation domain-containing protein
MKRGFTLIELMVSVAIFTVVMVIALGALLAVSAAERKAETVKSVVDNLNFALESMSRTIRTGYDYKCGVGGTGDCGSSGDPFTSAQSYIAFTAVDGSLVAYCLDGGVIKRQITTGVLSTDCTASVFLPITSTELVVSSLSFYVKGAPRTDTLQPKVTIIITAYANVGATGQTTFNIQTSITQRIYDQ